MLVCRVVSGPTLPQPMSGHCSARINDTHTFHGGGYEEVDGKNKEANYSWIYDVQKDSWTKTENMIVSAALLRCLTIGQSRVMALLVEENWALTNVEKQTEKSDIWQLEKRRLSYKLHYFAFEGFFCLLQFENCNDS